MPGKMCCQVLRRLRRRSQPRGLGSGYRIVEGSSTVDTTLCSRCRRLRSRTKSSPGLRARCARQNVLSAFAPAAPSIAASRARQRLQDRGGQFNRGHHSL
ncbi:hypothetical protein F2A38_00130 [Pseudomonas chlororaphis]|uniref:Uncharacterized protein n=1 Tax=Pseudomonas chlororaphis TaxID=587753 RepID=A0AB34CCU2_9PSED|nr:hypothetical protein F2A38_00130 [Pseudomonas chlororaphis]